MVTLTPTVRAQRSKHALLTCWASSRVGTRIRPRGARPAASPPNEADPAQHRQAEGQGLAELVSARPSTSRPAIASGRARAWIANGSRMSRAASAATSLLLQSQLGEGHDRPGWAIAALRQRERGPAQTCCLPAGLLAQGPPGGRPEAACWPEVGRRRGVPAGVRGRASTPGSVRHVSEAPSVVLGRVMSELTLAAKVTGSPRSGQLA